MTKDHHNFSNQYQPIFPPARLMRTAWSVRPPAAAGHRLLPALWHSAVCVREVWCGGDRVSKTMSLMRRACVSACVRIVP